MIGPGSYMADFLNLQLSKQSNGKHEQVWSISRQLKLQDKPCQTERKNNKLMYNILKHPSISVQCLKMAPTVADLFAGSALERRVFIYNFVFFVLDTLHKCHTTFDNQTLLDIAWLQHESVFTGFIPPGPAFHCLLHM